MVISSGRAAALLLGLAACAGADKAPADAGPAGGDTAGEGEAPAAAPDPEAALLRLSLDVRGVRPSLDELDRVAADPAALDALRAELLADPRWAERLVSAGQEVWSTVQDEAEHPASTFGLGDEAAFARAVGEEPLRLLAHVAVNDLPYTTLVTANYTVVDANLAAAWPVVPDAAPGEGWVPARWTDGRPAAGALVSNGLWWRYETSQNNASRGRANQISRIFLCRDYLSQPVEFDRSLDLSDPAVVADALRANPGCASCHSSLDPLASLLGGVYFARKSGPDEMRRYHPEREGIWRTQTGVAPAYFGQPAAGLFDLGQAIAADPGFVDCAVQQTAEHLLRRPLTPADTAARTRWREAFVRDGLKLRSLWAAVLADPLYLGPPTGEAEAAGQVGGKLLSPDQLSSQLAELTGFRFVVDGADLLRTSDRGLATLAGGSDGAYARGISQGWSATQVLVVRRVAQLAADHAVRVEPARLGLDPTATLDDAALREAVGQLHRRILSRRPTDRELDGLVAHHRLVEARTGVEAAWISVVVVLLRDPSFLIY